MLQSGLWGSKLGEGGPNEATSDHQSGICERLSATRAHVRGLRVCVPGGEGTQSERNGRPTIDSRVLLTRADVEASSMPSLRFHASGATRHPYCLGSVCQPLG
jgi:hypothetical protein